MKPFNARQIQISILWPLTLFEKKPQASCAQGNQLSAIAADIRPPAWEISRTFRCLCCQITSAFCAALDLLEFLTTFMDLQLICWILCRMILQFDAGFESLAHQSLLKKQQKSGVWGEALNILSNVKWKIWISCIIIIIYRALSVDINMNRL